MARRDEQQRKIPGGVKLIQYDEDGAMVLTEGWREIVFNYRCPSASCPGAKVVTHGGKLKLIDCEHGSRVEVRVA